MKKITVCFLAGLLALTLLSSCNGLTETEKMERHLLELMEEEYADIEYYKYAGEGAWWSDTLLKDVDVKGEILAEYEIEIEDGDDFYECEVFYFEKKSDAKRMMEEAENIFGDEYGDTYCFRKENFVFYGDKKAVKMVRDY